jgi:hypothetical protein
VSRGGDELGRKLWVDGVAEGAQDSHSIGKPIRRHHASGETSIPRHPGHFDIEGAAWLAFAVGVANKIKPEAEMVFADTDRREVSRPEGIAKSFQVIADDGMPVRGLGNLLAKDNARASCSDKLAPDWPEMPFAFEPLVSSSSGRRNRLTGTRPCPDRAVVGPAGNPERARPSADAGEEVALGVARKVGWSHVNDASLVNVSGREVSDSDKGANPLCGIPICLVVVGGHGEGRCSVRSVSRYRRLSM